ncbi:hypothetical protein GMDG_05129 [Pseudogymnoascus destructans 20631-21]|uniref:Uncharacterized protein n=1 Tax=Pseudogymnoascus destructans (strain ATCC MYA-4855 / 20631-21) TaxID=658429 RepID=L8FQG6_PSED2|nr:hypothetical protein GMDG_05129 [Pseudogymnoascus destructans 20631-21]
MDTAKVKLPENQKQVAGPSWTPQINSAQTGTVRSQPRRRRGKEPSKVMAARHISSAGEAESKSRCRSRESAEIQDEAAREPHRVMTARSSARPAKDKRKRRAKKPVPKAGIRRLGAARAQATSQSPGPTWRPKRRNDI